MRSIRRGLLVGIIGAASAATILTAAFVFHSARRSTDALLDTHLREIAMSVPALSVPWALLVPPDSPDARDIMLRIRDRNGVHVYRSSGDWELPEQAVLGFATVDTSRGRVRVYSTLRAGVLVQVAQPLDVRTRRAAQAALRETAPLALLGGALAVLVWILVGRGLEPLGGLRAALARRAPQSLQPLDTSEIPVELAPLVASINALMGRLEQALQRQRAFLADAAHELRTPLTAVRLQLDLLRRADPGAEQEQALERLGSGIDRVVSMVGQLLLLAREEAEDGGPRILLVVDPAELLAQCAADHAALASARRIDLGIVDGSAHAGELRIHGDPQALAVLLANLVGNSLRYVPSGGRIDLWCGSEDKTVVVRVDDDGPGIAPEQRERVFDRFYRVDPGSGHAHGEHGSGLGLAIVREIARHHGAQVLLDENPAGHGLRVEVRFPSAPEPGTERESRAGNIVQPS